MTGSKSSQLVSTNRHIPTHQRSFYSCHHLTASPARLYTKSFNNSSKILGFNFDEIISISSAILRKGRLVLCKSTTGRLRDEIERHFPIASKPFIKISLISVISNNPSLLCQEDPIRDLVYTVAYLRALSSLLAAHLAVTPACSLCISRRQRLAHSNPSGAAHRKAHRTIPVYLLLFP